MGRLFLWGIDIINYVEEGLMQLQDLLKGLLPELTDEINVRIVIRDEYGCVTHYKRVPISYIKSNALDSHAPLEIAIEEEHIINDEWKIY